MCYFLIVGLPARSQPLLQAAMARADLETRPYGNPTVAASFPRRDQLAIVTSGGCSCALYPSSPTAFNEDAKRLKYRKLGWTAAKIDRAIADKRPRSRPKYGELFCAFAGMVRSAGSARILAHSFSGLIASERTPFFPCQRLQLEAYLACEGCFAEDIVHDIRAPRLD